MVKFKEILEQELPEEVKDGTLFDLLSREDDLQAIQVKILMYMAGLFSDQTDNEQINLTRLNQVKGLPIRPDTFNQAESDEPVTIEPDSKKTILKWQPQDYGVILEIGATDNSYSRYNYSIDGTDLFPEPQREPLGLFNNPEELSNPILVENYATIQVKRLDEASSSNDYIGKFRVLEIDRDTYYSLASIWGG